MSPRNEISGANLIPVHSWAPDDDEDVGHQDPAEGLLDASKASLAQKHPKTIQPDKHHQNATKRSSRKKKEKKNGLLDLLPLRSEAQTVLHLLLVLLGQVLFQGGFLELIQDAVELLLSLRRLPGSPQAPRRLPAGSPQAPRRPTSDKKPSTWVCPGLGLIQLTSSTLSL